jgi:hypothetical protein
VSGGPDTPLGSRAVYLWQGNKNTLYRIRGMDHRQEHLFWLIRMINRDVVDLYQRAPLGATDLVGIPDLLRKQVGGYVPGDIKSGAGARRRADNSASEARGTRSGSSILMTACLSCSSPFRLPAAKPGYSGTTTVTPIERPQVALKYW